MFYDGLKFCQTRSELSAIRLRRPRLRYQEFGWLTSTYAGETTALRVGFSAQPQPHPCILPIRQERF